MSDLDRFVFNLKKALVEAGWKVEHFKHDDSVKLNPPVKYIESGKAIPSLPENKWFILSQPRIPWWKKLWLRLTFRKPDRIFYHKMENGEKW